MDEADAHRLRLARIAEMHLFAKQLERALVVGNDAADDLHQRGFARAVFADEDVNLLLAHVEMHVVQNFDVRSLDRLAVSVEDIFHNVVHVQDCLIHMAHPAFLTASDS